MPKLSRRGLPAVVGAALAIAILLPSSASAASTRAEYISQVDPICTSYAAPLGNAFKAYHKNFKALNKNAKSGTFKAFLRSLRATAASLTTIAGLHANMINQIAAVPPVPADQGTITAWLNALRLEQSSEVGAAGSLRHGKFKAFFNKLDQADGAVNAAGNAIQGFGFTVCGVTVT
jgi:hypothetical protein